MCIQTTEHMSMVIKHTSHWDDQHTWPRQCLLHSVCFNALSPDKPCENLFQKFHQQNYVLHSLYDTSVEGLVLKRTIDKWYSILSIARKYLKRVVRKWVEIKAHQVKNPFGIVLNSEKCHYYFFYCCSFSFIYLRDEALLLLSTSQCWL